MGYKRKPIDTAKTMSKKYVRYEEGAERYSMGVTKFMQLAREADAIYKIDHITLVNCDRFEAFLEGFRGF